jgi:hypothetical protein
LVALEAGDWIDVFSIEDGRSVAWGLVRAGTGGLRCELSQLAQRIGIERPLVGYGLTPSTVSEVESMETSAFSGRYTIDQRPEHPESLALSAAARILDGSLETPIELKRGPFGERRGHVALRPYAAALQVAILLLVVTLIGLFVYRGQQAAREAESAAAEQVDIYRQVFPTAKVPVGVANRLHSELAKLKGLLGGDEAAPSAISAITMLHDLLKSLPTDRRFVLLEIRIEEGRLYLDGEVREHGDAEALAQRLRAGGFDVASPRTHRLDEKRVSLRISGTHATVTKTALRKGI